jgi:hypothetical protein
MKKLTRVQNPQDPQILRMQCLQVAAGSLAGRPSTPKAVLERAEKFAAFVLKSA